MKEIKRSKHIDVRLTEEEYNTIKAKSRACGITASEYMRRSTLNKPIKSKVDQAAYVELFKVRGDLGRIGGLFKMYLTSTDKTKQPLGSRSHNDIDIDEILGQLEVKENELLEIARRLLD